jgi:hypothetical protein
VPYEDGKHANTGSVNVIFGSSKGLSAAGDQVWSQAVPGIESPPEKNDRFGFSLAAANFGGSGHADLAVGVPFEGVEATGAIHVIYGASSGLTAKKAQYITKITPGVQGGPDYGDRFGYSLAAGDLGRGAQADLAVGVPEDGAAYHDSGSVAVFYGSSAGLAIKGNQRWAQGRSGIQGKSKVRDRFGLTVSVTAVGGSAHADLVAGAPYKDLVAGQLNHGRVHVILGGDAGVTATGNTSWSQATPGILGDIEPGDRFGGGLDGATYVPW